MKNKSKINAYLVQIIGSTFNAGRVLRTLHLSRCGVTEEETGLLSRSGSQR